MRRDFALQQLSILRHSPNSKRFSSIGRTTEDKCSPLLGPAFRNTLIYPDKSQHAMGRVDRFIEAIQISVGFDRLRSDKQPSRLAKHFSVPHRAIFPLHRSV